MIAKRHLAWTLVLGLVLCAGLPSAAWAGAYGPSLGPPHYAPPTRYCTDCHATHGSGGVMLPRDAAQEAMCQSCHNPLGLASSMSDVANHVVNGGATVVDCGSCHDPHGPHSTPDAHTSTTAQNLKLIRGDTTKYLSGALEPAVFHDQSPESQIYTYTSEPYSGICQSCHTQTGHYRNTDGADPHYSETCTNCHPHEAGFAPQGACTDCHSLPQGSRRQVAEAGGDFMRTSHHVAGTVQDDDCTVCHYMGNHQQGVVKLKDPDQGESQIYDFVLANPSGIENFCLRCHDSDGALALDTSMQPFSDGQPPPDTGSYWTGSGHQLAAGVTCFGDGTTGCHANAHGSEKVRLLAPYDVAPTPPGYVEEEEGFCFTCHDADGPSIYDAEITFSGTASGVRNNNRYVNPHHDVSYSDQTLSGAKIECTDCHNMHRANDEAKTVLDPDPDDGIVPAAGVSWPGSTYRDEFCLDCHDNSFPSTVTAPSVPLEDIRYEWLYGSGGNEGQHGLNDGSTQVALRAGSGYQRGDVLHCMNCHAKGHGSDNLYRLKETIYSKDGTTPLLSDAGTTEVYVTDISAENEDAQTNGRNWCSTCHPDPMGKTKKKGCLSGSCHNHAQGF